MELLHMDEYVDQLLTQERVCDVILPRIQVWSYAVIKYPL